MNIDELKQTLTNMADEVEHTHAQARLDGIDSKAATARRNKLLSGGAVASVAVVVAVTVVGPQLVNEASNSPAGPATNTTNSDTDKRADGKRDEDIVQTDEDVLQTDLPTVTDNGITFYTEPAGDRLLSEAVGRPGQRSVSFTATPATTDLSWVNICSASLPERVNRIWTSVSVNGNTLGSSGCQEPTGPLQAEGSFGSSPTASQRAWEELGVVAGEPSVFSLRLKPGSEKIEGLRDAQIGLAIYENTGARFEDHGLWFKRERVVDGHTYRLAGESFSKFSGGRGEMRVPLPPAEHPLFLAFGVAEVAGPYRTFENAEGANVSSAGGWSESGTFAKADQDSAQLRIRTKRDDGTGLLYILAYERID